MKKILTVLLALAMCLSLCACGSAGNNGGNFLTKSEWKDIGNKESTLTFNPNGTGIFEGRDMTWAQTDQKIVKWSAKVYDIYGDSCQMAIKQSGSTPVNSIFVYMGTDELIKFNKFDEITIVGVLEIDDHYYQIGGAFVVETK